MQTKWNNFGRSFTLTALFASQMLCAAARSCQVKVAFTFCHVHLEHTLTAYAVYTLYIYLSEIRASHLRTYVSPSTLPPKPEFCGFA